MDIQAHAVFVSLYNCDRIVKNQITGFGMPVFLASEQKKILPKGNSEKYPSFSHSGSLSDRLNNAREDEKYTGYEIGMNFELFAQYLHNSTHRKNIFMNIGEGIRSNMNGKQIAGALIGAFIAFLGLLWSLQGIGILQIRPIFCVADCEEIVGGSPSWAVVGVITFIIGIIILIMSVRRFGKTP